MGGINIGGVQIDPYGKGKEAAGHVVGQVAGDEKRKEAEALADKAARAYGQYKDPFGAHKKAELLTNPKDKAKYTPFGVPESEASAAIASSRQTLIDQLQLERQGLGGPTAAQAQLQSATDKNMRGALAMAASGRGNPALAAQAAGRQRAQMGLEAGAQATSLRAQEEQQATSNLLRAMQQASAHEQGTSNLEMQMNRDALNQVNAQNAADAAERAGVMGGTIDVLTGIATANAGPAAGKATKEVLQTQLPEEDEPQTMPTGGPVYTLTGAPPQAPGLTNATMGTAPQLQAMQGFQPAGGFGGMGGGFGGGGFAPPMGGGFPGGGFTGSPEQMAYQRPQEDEAARRQAQMQAMASRVSQFSQMGRF